MTLEPINIVCPHCGKGSYMRQLVGKGVGRLDIKCINCNSYFNSDELFSKLKYEAIQKKSVAMPNNIFKPMTNADRIRAMTDEELADFIGGIFTIERDMWGDYDPRTVVTQEPRVEVRNTEDMLEWLKQEVDDES